MASNGWNIGGSKIEIPPALKNIKMKGIILIAFILYVLFNSIYQIGAQEVGVILQFGKFDRTEPSGLHFKIPFGIEKLLKVPIERTLKEEFGFRTYKPGVRTQYVTTSDSEKEAIMLTGDLNVAVVEWIVQYKIKDPYQFLFKFRNARATFRNMNEAVVRKIVGDNSVDEVITIGRARIEAQIKEELQALCDLYEIGLEINQVKLQDVNPPDPVKPSFNEVNEAQQERERKINEAWSEYNQEIPRAQGEAEQMIRGAEGYALERVNMAIGDANRFKAIYKEYRRAPVVTRKRLYLETLEDILPKMKQKIIFDDKQKNILPLLNLGEGVQK